MAFFVSCFYWWSSDCDRKFDESALAWNDARRKVFEQVSNDKFYKPLEKPIVSQTASKAKTIVNTLFTNGHIDEMTHKWLNSGQKPPRLPEFYALTKIHKVNPVGRPIVSGSGGPTERISSFVDSLLQPMAKKQETVRSGHKLY